MKTLVIGGTGMIGCHAATLLAERGHEVTIGARSAPAEESPAAVYPVLLGDYADGGLTEAELEPYDAIVFAAGQDVRKRPRLRVAAALLALAAALMLGALALSEWEASGGPGWLHLLV